tara:strand:+ start:224 stop:670 length:447 start_codon:yes stop_codon:yes gene_type:complete
MYRNKNSWPFVAQNMFAHRYKGPIQRIFIVLLDNYGHETTILPSRVIPVAFFRAQRMVLEVFTNQFGAYDRNEYANEILQNLNNKPWSRFDEIDPSIQPKKGRRFIGLQVQVCTLELMKEGLMKIESAIMDRNVIYEYIQDHTFEQIK